MNKDVAVKNVFVWLMSSLHTKKKNDHTSFILWEVYQTVGVH